MRTIIVLRCLGVLLLVAAGLKMHGLLAADAVARRGVFATPWLQAAILYCEILLALWLWLGRHVALKWLAALATFGSFFVLNLWLAIDGQTRVAASVRYRRIRGLAPQLMPSCWCCLRLRVPNL
jgi:hypothetical protein